MSKAVLTDLATGREYLLDGEASIGRGSDNTVVLNDATVSSHHATLSSTGAAWYIADNNSRNGVEMNNFRIPALVKLGLRDGCQLKIGNTLLRFTTSQEAIRRLEGTQRRNTPTQRITPTGGENPGANPGNNPGARPGANAGPTGGANGPGANAGGKKWKRWLPAVLSVAAVLALILGWCLMNHMNGGKRMEEADYEGAFETYGNDFLFSSQQRLDAAMQAGEAAFSAGDYPKAMDYFRAAWDAGRARRADAVYEQARLLIREGENEEAIRLLEEISQETRAQEQIGLASLNIARRQFAEGDTEAAIQMAKEIRNTEYADVVSFLDEVYHKVGKDLFSAKDYRGAMEAYVHCEKDLQGRTNASILFALLEEGPYSAALLVDDAVGKGETDLTRTQWMTAINAFIGKPDSTDLKRTLEGEAARIIVAGSSSFGDGASLTAFQENAPKGPMVGSYTKSTDDEYVVQSLAYLLERSGASPDGKILIVAQRRSYSDKETSCAILLSLMRLLPEQYFPISLAEVEYLVVVDYDYQVDGSYMLSSTKGLQESAQVRVLHATDGEALYESETIKGSHSPQSFTYMGTPPAWKSGGSPAMGEEIHKAISAIIGWIIEA